MAPLPSIEPPVDLQWQLLARAREAIRRCLGLVDEHKPEDPVPETWDQPVACFVTLHSCVGTNKQLRGCIGTLEPGRSLSQAIDYFAEQAAFHDPRFSPLRVDELDSLQIEISLLSSLQPLVVEDEQDLYHQLRPGIDGVWLEAGGRRATFLPQVWQQLPAADDFIAQLKRKAGLAADSWSDDYRWSVYQAFHFSEP